MTSALRLSTQTSFLTAWQLGQLRFLQEQGRMSVCPQESQRLRLKPSFPDLQERMSMEALRWAGDWKWPEEQNSR